MESKTRIIGGIATLFIGLSLGACAGTQWLAQGFGYNEALGNRLLEWNEFLLYPPWRLFQWGPILRSIAPELVSQGYSFVLGGGVLGLVGLMGLSAFSGNRINRETLFGDSRFATVPEIEEAGLIDSGTGVFLGKLEDGRHIRHESESHYAVIAPSRAGKGEGVVIPTLLSYPHSAFVYDLKRENYEKTAGLRSRISDVYCIDSTSRYSARINPLLEIRPGDLETRDAQNLSQILVEPEIQGKPDHWARTANAILTGVILHILYTAPNELKNLAGVVAFLSQAEHSIRETLHQMMETKHLCDPETGEPKWTHPGISAAGRDVLNKSPDDLSGVISTMIGFLAVFRDTLLARITRDSDFRIVDLVAGERPKTVYLVVPTSDIDRLRPFVRLTVNLMLRRLTEPPSLDPEIKVRRKLLLMLDEFPALGRLEFLESALGFIAGFGLKAVLVAQSLNQIRQVYGPNTSILDNTDVQLFMRPRTPDTAEYISRLLGDTTVSYKTQGLSGERGNPFYSNKSESEHFSKRPLMTPREIMNMKKQDELLFLGDVRPIKCKRIEQWHDPAFNPLRLPAPDLKKVREVLDSAPKPVSPWYGKEFLKRKPTPLDEWKWPEGESSKDKETKLEIFGHYEDEELSESAQLELLSALSKKKGDGGDEIA